MARMFKVGERMSHIHGSRQFMHSRRFAIAGGKNIIGIVVISLITQQPTDMAVIMILP